MKVVVIVGGWLVEYQTIWREPKKPAIDISAPVYEQWTRVSSQINRVSQFRLKPAHCISLASRTLQNDHLREKNFMIGISFNCSLSFHRWIPLFNVDFFEEHLK